MNSIYLNWKFLEVFNDQMFDEYWGITELQQQFMWLENKNEN